MFVDLIKNAESKECCELTLFDAQAIYLATIGASRFSVIKR
jgi:hypothetical protein